MARLEDVQCLLFEQHLLIFGKVLGQSTGCLVRNPCDPLGHGVGDKIAAGVPWMQWGGKKRNSGSFSEW